MADILTPALGESVTEATVAKWTKQTGEMVKRDELILELETDKVSLEVVAPEDGVLTIDADAGSVVVPGQRLGSVGASADGAKTAPAPAAPAPTTVPTPAQPALALAPSVQRIVAENALDPTGVAGSGKDGRLTKGDALAAVQAKVAAPVPTPAPVPMPAPAPAADPVSPRILGPREERVRMTRLRQTIARRLKDAQNTAAMLTTFNEVDMTAVMALRNQYKDAFEKRHGVKLGFMSVFVKACVGALKDIPAVNAEIDGQDLVYKNHYDIGIAVGTDKGLVVPVVRDADALSLADIEKAISAYGRKAREGRLAIEDMQGGTFSITNGGIYGSLMSTPILNAPQSGILGMHAIKDRPMVVGGEIKIRPMMYLALSYDHRVVDGKEAVSFLVAVKDYVEDPQRLLLDL